MKIIRRHPDGISQAFSVVLLIADSALPGIYTRCYLKNHGKLFRIARVNFKKDARTLLGRISW
jgi:hypothetical protein